MKISKGITMFINNQTIQNIHEYLGLQQSIKWIISWYAIKKHIHSNLNLDYEEKPNHPSYYIII